MILKGASLAGIALLAASGFALCYLALRRTMFREMVERQNATDRQMQALAATVHALEAKVAALNPASVLPAEAASEFKMAESAEAAIEPPHASENEIEDESEEEITPEMMVVLAAAVTSFLGRKVRILSAKKLQSPRQGMSPWSQQGRVFVQASHNLRVRG